MAADHALLATFNKLGLNQSQPVELRDRRRLLQIVASHTEAHSQAVVGAQERQLESANVALAANPTPAPPQHTGALRDPYANNTKRHATRTSGHCWPVSTVFERL
jgi:hypothetical protein